MITVVPSTQVARREWIGPLVLWPGRGSRRVWEAGRVTRRVETAGIERCEKHPTSSVGDEVGGGVWILFWYR